MGCMALAVVLAGCGNSDGNRGSAVDHGPASAGQGASNDADQPEGQVELIVSAAASMTDALGEIKKNYEAVHRNVAIRFNFGASGTLQKQIEQGAPADLFLSASPKNMEPLIDKGLIDTEHEGELLSNELVVVVPAGAKTRIDALADLAAASVKRMAVGIPESVPAGVYAKEALSAAKLWDALQAKTVQGKDVRQVLQYVETGNADAGFVYKTDALTSKKVSIAFAVDAAAHAPILYPAGVVKGTKQMKQAEEFYAYLRSTEAMKVFEAFGFAAAT
ncbi:molybdate ABC transporter substrate-binding protein [Paenibacillus sacheonensis]|uniref:Molybdate ABC transporter substrate-binding protein n=2 Tax=Paenibacillus sacheonensis TaxID=742054 RepID=A0A7X5C0J2_9BACL|nr:molybdate ABC transporter substrate-binding protein [Paenibacillus sacheonensis]